jgi:hypothetical protein
MNGMLRQAIISGHLRWILPVENMSLELVRGRKRRRKLPTGGMSTEVERANEAIAQWSSC